MLTPKKRSGGGLPRGVNPITFFFIFSVLGLVVVFFYFQLHQWRPSSGAIKPRDIPQWNTGEPPKGYQIEFREQLKNTKIAVTSLDFKIQKDELLVLKELCELNDPKVTGWTILIVEEDEVRDRVAEERRRKKEKENSEGDNSQEQEGEWEGDEEELPTLSTHCVTLSIKAQNKLHYRIASPSTPHSRKNVGYLYAIHHGATLILDLDSTQSHIVDPLPLNFRARELMDFGPFTPAQKNRPGVVNPYRYYGLSHLRPRGFPLHFEEPTNYTWQPWSFGNQHSPIPDGVEVVLSVQQGLFQKHPDATEKSTFEKFSDSNYFARPLPWQPGIAIDKGSFTPLLGRNAFFYPNAFWGLIMPTTKIVSEMSADVFRGFWVQRLLWDMGQNLGFFYSSVTRDIQKYSSSSIAYGGLQKDTPEASRRLVEVLNSWKQDSTNTFDRIISVFLEMEVQGLISTEEVNFAFDWLNDLYDLHYIPPSSSHHWNREKTFRKPTDSIETLRGDNSDHNVVKKYVYLSQTEKSIPEIMTKLPEDTDLILIYYKQQHKTHEGVFYPKSTWTEGRNRMFQEALQREKYLGYQYHFMFFTDDDWTMECTAPGFPNDDMKKCYEYIHQVHEKWQPAVGDCTHPGPKFAVYPEESDADVTWLDAFWNSFHREFVDMIVPYNRTYDAVAWPGSQGYVRWQSHTFWPHHVVSFTKIDCRNGQHRGYQGQNNIQSWGPIGEWIKSSLPGYFRFRAQDWPGGYLGGSGPFSARMKTRVYDDVCSTTDTNQVSFCLDKP